MDDATAATVGPAVMPREVERELAEQLVDRARAEGLDLTGPDGVLTGLTKRVLQTALEVELTDHLGYEPHDPAVAMGINLDGERDVLGLWVGPTGGEGAKHWLAMLTELRNRGVADVCIVCCDGLLAMPDAIAATWPQATIQTCVVHLVRNSLRYASKAHWSQITNDMRAIYTAPTVEAAEACFGDFTDRWASRYPAMIKVWERAWPEFVPFLGFPPEIRKVVYTTNAIESLNARFRKATRRRGHFPNEQAGLKVLYLAIRERDPGRSNPVGRVSGWKAASTPSSSTTATGSSLTNHHAPYTQNRTVPPLGRGLRRRRRRDRHDRPSRPPRRSRLPKGRQLPLQGPRPREGAHRRRSVTNERPRGVNSRPQQRGQNSAAVDRRSRPSVGGGGGSPPSNTAANAA
jgi:hypothetical protein